MERRFVPQPGQIDYTDAKRAPVLHCIVVCEGKVLLVQRSSDLRLYPNYWSGISGFLDTAQTVQEKAQEELKEEAGISETAILSLSEKEVFERYDEEKDRTWIVHPLLVHVKKTKLTLNWEAQNFRWVRPKEISTSMTVPGFQRVLELCLGNDWKTQEQASV